MHPIVLIQIIVDLQGIIPSYKCEGLMFKEQIHTPSTSIVGTNDNVKVIDCLPWVTRSSLPVADSAHVVMASTASMFNNSAHWKERMCYPRWCTDHLSKAYTFPNWVRKPVIRQEMRGIALSNANWSNMQACTLFSAHSLWECWHSNFHSFVFGSL